MSERFQFSTVWQETDPAGIARDYLTVHTFHEYSLALDQHRKACKGEWVDGQLWPEVTSLVGAATGRAREIRAGRTLWVDDRPPLTREGFSALRKSALSKMDARKVAA